MDLEIVVVIKGEIIHGENHANEVTECASGNGCLGGSAWKTLTFTSIDTFIMWDISLS